MTIIDPKDASLLAFLAERPRRSSKFTEHAFFKLKGAEAQNIAVALTGKRRGVPQNAVETAEQLQDWVKSNRKNRG